MLLIKKVPPEYLDEVVETREVFSGGRKGFFTPCRQAENKDAIRRERKIHRQVFFSL